MCFFEVTGVDDQIRFDGQTLTTTRIGFVA